VGTNSEVYNGILSLVWRWLTASVPYVLSHHLFECTLFVSADVPQGRSWVQKQKFAVIVSGRVIQQEHVKRDIALVVRRSIIPWYVKALCECIHKTQCSMNKSRSIRFCTYTVIINIQGVRGPLHKCGCSLDSTSQVSFITRAMVNIPGMRRKRKFIPVKGINNVVSDTRHGANIQLCNRNSGKSNVLYLT
jgi:hypothetical protein